MKTDANTKPQQVDFFKAPGRLWRFIKRELPKDPSRSGPGRPRIPHRNIIDGLWYLLWTGCQWKAIHKDWFGASSSVLHERLQTWQKEGCWERILLRLVRFYARELHVAWKWQSVDSKSVPAPLGGSATGCNPTDRSKCGSKIHLLVDQRGAPLAVFISGANQHDKWFVDELIISMVVKRPTVEQHLCADKGYDYPDVHAFASAAEYQLHIKHRRRRGEPEAAPLDPAEKIYPARRWVVERTLGWLTKRRSLRTRWCKKDENWLALVMFACASILHDLVIFG